MSITPTTTGYADVNGLHLYYETYGSGAPLVLLHGGMLTIDLNFATSSRPWRRRIPSSASRCRGTDAPPTSTGRSPTRTSRTDIVALLDHLGIERAAVLGHSMGGGVALELAVSHPDRVSAIVPISASVSKDGMHPDLLDPSTFETSPIMPTAQDFADFKERVRAPVSAPGAVRRVPHVAQRDGQRLRRLDRRAARRHLAVPC